MIRAGNNAEEDRIRMLDKRPRFDFMQRRLRHIRKEQVGDVALKNDDLTVTGEDAGEHADRTLQHGHDCQHGGHAERDAGNADEGANPMPQQIGDNEF